MSLRTIVVAFAMMLPLAAQEGTLDLLDGETLYRNGWLFTLGVQQKGRTGLLDGDDRVSDSQDQRRLEETYALGAHYGVRHNLQLSVIAPYERRVLKRDHATAADRLSGEGLGDGVLGAKWRFYRWDAPHVSLNVAAITGLESPTGSDGENDRGVRLPPDLQPGSGSWDPAFGLASTYEPYRWRFNVAALYQRNGLGGAGYKFGDELFAELAAGNRFWLEPYPGPFMRLDVNVRYRKEWKALQSGDLVHDSGGDLVTLAPTLAFRPRPVLDFQLSVEIPVYQRVNGRQLEEDFVVFFVFGYRM